MQVDKLFDVKGKIVLVTGGGRGVGEMIAAGYVANGAKVYISSRTASACEKTASELTASGKASGGSCIALPADLAKYEECLRVVKELEQREGKLDILVNNSGATWGEPLDEYPDAAWTKLLTLNVQRVFTLTQKLLPLLKKAAGEKGVSRVINASLHSQSVAIGFAPLGMRDIGSINGVNPPGMETFAYSASKAALHQLTRHLAPYLGPNVTVNALALGPFRSKMMAATLDSFEAEIAGGLPQQRIGSPEDVAAACLWLSGRGGEWVTGTIVPIDGGSLVAMKSKL